MNFMQYQNILKWSSYRLSKEKEMPSLTAVRRFCDNLGVAFPNGEIRTVRAALESDHFLGWRKCSAEEAQPYADVGVPTVGLTNDKVFLICPDPQINDLTQDPDIKKAHHPCVKHTRELTSEEKAQTVYFTYRYGFVLGKERT